MKLKILNLLIVSILFGTNLSLFGKESIPSFYVSKNSLDKNLKKDEAVFCINFSTNDNGTVKNTVKWAYNGKTISQKPDANGNIILKTKPGKYVLQFYYNSDYNEVKTDSIAIKPGYKIEIKVNFESSKFPVIADKPVIYVYPQNTTTVNIKLNFKGTLGFTYPKYNNGWNFIADSNGILNIGNKKYHYLFYDGAMDLNSQNLR